MQVSKHHPRHRPATVDPFSDPANVSYSAYGAPTLSRNAPQPSLARPPPPPPPKQPAKPATRYYPQSQRPYAAPSPGPNRQNIMDAVRDTVTVRGVSDQNTRHRVGRSQTELPP